MSKILKRPMFRKGGSTNEGIVSMAVPRGKYANSNASDFGLEDDQMLQQAQRYANIAQKVVGSSAAYDPVARFLIDFGQSYGSARPMGRGVTGALSTAAAAAKEPTKALFEGLDKREAARKQLGLFGLQQAFGENLAQIRAKREYAKDKLLSDERREIEIQKELSKLYGPQFKDGIEIRGAIIDREGRTKIARTLNNIDKGRIKLSEKETLSGANVSRAPIVDGSITDSNYLNKQTKEPDPTLYKPGQFYVNHDGDIYFYQGKNKFKKVFGYSKQ